MLMFRYIKVRFEQLLGNPVGEVGRLYRFMKTKVTREVSQFWSDHTSRLDRPTIVKLLDC